MDQLMSMVMSMIFGTVENSNVSVEDDMLPATTRDVF